MKSTAVAYVLWLFLGILGIHKFYVGKTVMGVFYLMGGLTAAALSLIPVLGWFLAAVPAGIVGIFLLIDLFTLPRQVRQANERAAVEMGRFQAKVDAARLAGR
jgi:TM2 domain-containing membrane protein YozV